MTPLKLLLGSVICLGGLVGCAGSGGNGAYSSQNSGATAPSYASNSSVAVGTWFCTHPDWKDLLILRPDGSFYGGGDGRHAGSWTTVNLKGRLALSLEWTQWAPETLMLTGPNTFEGKVGRNGKFIMRRCYLAPDAPVQSNPPQGVSSAETSG